MTRRSIYEGVYVAVTADNLRTFAETVLPQALAGDYEALQRVFFISSQAIQKGVPLPPSLAAFVAQGLYEMAGGEDPKEAWAIQRKRGQKDTTLAFYNATRRTLLVEEARQSGLTYEQAVSRIAERECVSTDSVELAYKKHRHKITVHANGTITMFTAPSAPENK